MSKIPAKTKKERIAEAVAKAVGAGRQVAIQTVDFNDPFRPKTCLEVDFPILPINQIAAIEGNAGKPIYQMSKWWARRRSSVFRAMLIAAAMKAPDDPAEAAKAVWDVYYANHQAKGALKHLKVADIFMGGGTTIVEGSRLGMQMYGNDLNPVAWFIVKNELAEVDPEEVKALLDDIEAEVKPQIMPFYACDCPRGHKGKWMRLSANKVMGADFDPLRLTPENRKDYRYEGPEVIYVFWAKHGTCQMTGCGHRTPIMPSPVMAIKTLSVKAWENYGCGECGKQYDVEAQEARMAPGAPLVIAEAERPYALLDAEGHVSCPHCGHKERFTRISVKAKNKKIELSLLAHPQWLRGSLKRDGEGREFGGSATDSAEATAAWNQERARQMRLVEARGALPPEITCPDTGVTFRTDEGTVPKKSKFACGSCGAAQDLLETIKATGKTGPLAAYAIQGYCPECDGNDEPYGGRFFIPVNDTSGIDAANQEWSERSESDLKNFWPRSELPFGFMTHLNNGGLPNHGFTHWWKMFNARQLLLHTQLLRAILNAGAAECEWITREFVLGAFQQYLRNQSLFTLWNAQRDTPEPMFSNNNYHPKATMIENSVFSAYGRGNWASCVSALHETIDWKNQPWEIVSNTYLESRDSALAELTSGKSEKVYCDDGVIANVKLRVASSTELNEHATESFDLVITDPPFGGLLHYSELSDFFHVWLRLALKDRYPECFSAEYTPKTLEAVANRARRDDPDAFYRRLLTECWREAHRILKPSGILAFTFHHSEDEPWVAVLESLFDAGFYLEATYPIRSDETKGAGAKPGTFGSQKIEYDIVHVCRKRVCGKRVCDKRAEEPQPVSWGRMRREVLKDVRQFQQILEHHAKQGLPAADLQVIKRGKALEYFSRHYGKVYVDDGKEFTVRDALIGVSQLLDEETSKASDPPPVNAEPFTRQFLRLFDGLTELTRDQMQKYLRGTGIAPSEFVERGWCFEEKKVYYPTPPLEIAKGWRGRHRQKMTSDFDQALFLIGACFPSSGVNAQETLKNANFRPHPALGALLDWFARHSGSEEARQAATMAAQIYRVWASHSENQDNLRQLSFFEY